MMKPSYILLGLCLLAPFVLHAVDAAPVDELGKAKAFFAQRLQEIKQKSDAARADQLVRYRRALDAFRASARQNGDLDALQAAEAEITRFGSKKALPVVGDDPVNADLAKGAASFREAADQTNLECAREVVQLVEKYVQYLQPRVTKAVQADQIELAQKTRSEMQAARETPDYQAAKFLLGEKETQAAATKPDVAAANPPPDKPSPRPSSDPTERTEPRTDPDGLYDAARVSEGLPAVSLTAPSPYRPLMCTDTGKGTLTGGLGIAMDGFLDSSSARYQLRVKLRPKSSGDSFQNLKVLAQYFVRNPNGGGVQEGVLQYAPVATVGAKQTTCEFKPADLPSSSNYRSHVRNGSWTTTEDREGGPFVGVVVTVFSAEDKLLAQSASSPSLRDKGKTAFERPSQWVNHVVEGPMLIHDGGMRVIRWRTSD